MPMGEVTNPICAPQEMLLLRPFRGPPTLSWRTAQSVRQRPHALQCMAANAPLSITQQAPLAIAAGTDALSTIPRGKNQRAADTFCCWLCAGPALPGAGAPVLVGEQPKLKGPAENIFTPTPQALLPGAQARTPTGAMFRRPPWGSTCINSRWVTCWRCPQPAVLHRWRPYPPGARIALRRHAAGAGPGRSQPS